MWVMDDTNETRSTSSGTENLTLQNRIPRDMLQRFMGGSSSRQSELKQEPDDDDSGEIELNLGLSLGGRFGVDKSSNKLVRSSSIPGPITLVRYEHDVLTPPATVVAYTDLVRTSSLPVETEEEWRKREDMQSSRRMEAKRRRSERQRVLKGDQKDEERKEIEVNLKGRAQTEQYIAAMNKVGSSVAPQFGLPSWAAARQTILGGGIEAFIGRGKGKYVTGDTGSGGSRQGSVDSRGGCSSSMPELDRKPLQGSSSCGNMSPASLQSDQNRSNQDTVGSSGSKSGENAGKPSGAEVENPSKRMDDKAKESGMNSMEDMPCVFTKGEGPNGRKIEGILYKYGKGEQVRIMCVCHGSFHSPAGFVKHAGGTDITHPLKHIVVNPNSSCS